MKKLLFLAALFVAAAFSSCEHDGETPDPQPLAIAFAEGNEFFFDFAETKTVHYTITGGSDKTGIEAEMLYPDGTYMVETTPTSATEGTIAITAQVPMSNNRVLVSVWDGLQIVRAKIAVSTTSKFPITVATPGTLVDLLAGYDTTKITELTVIGNLNDTDIKILKNLPNLAVLDMENANLDVLPAEAFFNKKLLTSVKLPQTLKAIEFWAFTYCSGLTSITIPNGVTSIGNGAFSDCSGLTSVTIGNSVKSIGGYAFSGCSLASIYCKAQIPPTIESTTFVQWSDFTLLYVPTGCKKAYATAEYWKDAKTIIEMEF